jgi:hypothetical protein
MEAPRDQGSRDRSPDICKYIRKRVYNLTYARGHINYNIGDTLR